jgi:short-subunit dehydrogenase
LPKVPSTLSFLNIFIALAAKGAKVVLVARSKDKLDKVAQEIKQSGGSATAFSCDLTKPESVAILVRQITEQFGIYKKLIFFTRRPS